MTDEYVRTLIETQPIKSLKAVQHFLGFANFYGRFIKDYSKVSPPLTNSTPLPANEWRASP